IPGVGRNLLSINPPSGANFKSISSQEAQVNLKIKFENLKAFCIPVVERAKAYISQTLHSLFSNLEEQFKQDVVFIVIFAYTNTTTNSFRDQAKQLMETYSVEIEQGLLEVAAIPPKWYDPDMEDILPTFNDSSARMLWRTKQNQDYIYMMNYGSKRAEYYMQLEDDIISTAKYG
ncbi:N-Acetylglucosaminyltransferase-IV region, partial [Teladorsagia circumcincta]